MDLYPRARGGRPDAVTPDGSRGVPTASHREPRPPNSVHVRRRRTTIDDGPPSDLPHPRGGSSFPRAAGEWNGPSRGVLGHGESQFAVPRALQRRRCTLVSGGWRHATFSLGRISTDTFEPLHLLLGSRGGSASSRTWPGCSRDRPAVGASAVHDQGSHHGPHPTTAPSSPASPSLASPSPPRPQGRAWVRSLIFRLAGCPELPWRRTRVRGNVGAGPGRSDFSTPPFPAST